ncbi:chitin deacetylase [Flagelloscypha sp. PMI_526]|nr:chitin deacetylase [Flagelloscypha sp. PMI_526]
MKLSLASPTLVLASFAMVEAHKMYRQEQHSARAHEMRAHAAELAGRDFLHPLAEHPQRRQAGAAVSGASGATTPAAAATPSQSFSFSLASSNPTAIPLASINSAAPSAPTHALKSTPAAGSTPSNIKGAPPLPAPSLVIGNYPALDVIPPVDSDQVKQWIAEVKASGVSIPNITATTGDGSCSANAAAAADTSRCWWTCGGCVRDTDVQACPDKNTWGLTYDDGPSPYTPDLLNFLDEKQLKGTFFVTGSRSLSYPAILQAEYMAGHQISVHTWSHHALTTMTNEQIIAELGWTKKVIHDVLGVTPTTMRPPFGDIDDRVRAICKAMNLTPILWTRISPTLTLDTDDFDIHGGLATVDHVLFNWQNILSNVSSLSTGFIVLEHDLFQQSVEVATGYILPDAIARANFKIMPVQTCLKADMANAYLETNDNSTNPLPASGGKPGSAQSGSGSTSGNGATGVRDVVSGMVGAAAVGLGALLL